MKDATAQVRTIDFLKYRQIVLFFTAFVFAASAGLALYRYQTRGSAFMYSVDFTGGTQVLLKFNKNVSSRDVKNALESQGLPGVITREFQNNELLVRVKAFENDANGLGGRIRQIVQEAVPGIEVTILSTEAVGPGIGAELRDKSIYAILFSLIALLLYIAVTFWSFSYGIGAIVALIHDAIIMLTFFLLFDRDISITVIGAILAVLGYSINDTIVIFSRIRSNLKKLPQMAVIDVINLSITQTLTRTLLTSFTTLLTVLSMVIFGGEALRDFSMVLLIGIIFGTYSSIFIASPVMMLFYRREKVL